MPQYYNFTDSTHKLLTKTTQTVKTLDSRFLESRMKPNLKSRHANSGVANIVSTRVTRTPGIRETEPVKLPADWPSRAWRSGGIAATGNWTELRKCELRTELPAGSVGGVGENEKIDASTPLSDSWLYVCLIVWLCALESWFYRMKNEFRNKLPTSHKRLGLNYRHKGILYSHFKTF